MRKQSGRHRYAHLDGDSEFFPFGARTHLRQKQHRGAVALRVGGFCAILLAAAVLLRQSTFRGGQPLSPLSGSTATAEAARFSESKTVEAAIGVTITDASLLPEYRALYAKNHDMVGWLKIPGTEIDYAVLQTPGDNEYYLRRGFDKIYSPSGSLFLDENCRIAGSTTANWLIYGHNMRDGSMFGTLQNYASADFYAAHPTFTFDTLYQRGTWQVVAAFETTLGADSLPYYTFFDAANAQDWQTRYNAIMQKALYHTGADAAYGDQLLTLSTCGESSSLTKARFAVLAKRISS
jgi:sortase B